ncbi:hypothetical protein GUITHDRAFT_154637 [Guillardia theta CCMP2712]|uniref:RWP-RK domain-containing protein n=1 Tax=Guillardia theta (strain CCMP2712) TaxID=905079 RepID=L1IQT4_GUITC|nr:hypothetical protein GUITHDRAFT_154637 [Guillardia theta CCMP2712]EKX38618.1 hypothetical protein GUITHDRAFT_154637 [Guillardia theta CCMP2712]|eukprot:XP_005825598.1 hypothetical protein GUITHDRAFT_154637 [Guillardia theta CCMP2712]
MLSQHPQPPFLSSPAPPQTEPPSCQDRLQHDSISSQISSARVALVCPRKKKAGPGQSPRQPDDPVVLTRELLEGLFDRSLAAASEALGICPTAIKKACRRLGIDKWPFKGPAGRSSKPPTPPSSSAMSGGCVASVEVSACEDLPLSSHDVCSLEIVPSKCEFLQCKTKPSEFFSCFSFEGHSRTLQDKIDDPHCTETRHCPLLLQRRDSLDQYASMLAVPPGEEGQGDAVFWKELLGMLPEEVKGKRVEADFDFSCRL